MNASEIRAALASSDVELRREAVLAAAQLADRTLAGPLLVALGDDDWRVRQEAVRSVRELALSLDLLSGLIDAVCQGSNVGLRTSAREVLQSLGAAGARAVIEAMPNVEPHARKFLIDTLVCDGVDEVLSTLVQVVRGDDSMNAISAIDALASLGGARAEGVLRERLAGGDTFLRAAALDALDRLGAQLSWDELSPLLADRVLGSIALSALGRSRDVRAVAPLLVALEERSDNVRARALQALQHLFVADPGTMAQAIASELAARSAQLLDQVASFALDEDVALASAALCVLGCARDARALRAAVHLCGRSVPVAELTPAFAGWQAEAARFALQLVRSDAAPRAAVFALVSGLLAPLEAAVAADDVVPGQAELVRDFVVIARASADDRDASVQVVALRALGAFGEPADVGVLCARAHSEHEGLARAAVAALSALAQRAPDAVRECLAQLALSGAASMALAELLVKLRGEAALPQLRAALLSDVAERRVAAIAGLSLLGGASAVELTALALNDEDPQVQVAALDALPRVGSGFARAVEALLLFDSNDDDVQAALAGALAALGEPRAIARLRKLARVGAPGVRVFAMQGLQGLSDPALDELLVEALGDADSEVVKQALSALGAAGGQRSAARIAIALDHAAWDVRRLAASLLGRLGDAGALAALQARLLTESDALVRAELERALARAEAR